MKYGTKAPTLASRIVHPMNFPCDLSVTGSSKPLIMDATTLQRAPKSEAASNDERWLVEQAKKGDREAFEQLVHLHDRDILRLAFHMLGNREEARDVFQETFLKAYRSMGRFRSESSFYTWIYRIATNVALDKLRKRQALRDEISYDADAEAHPDRPALKDTFEEKSYYSNPERRLYGREVGDKIQDVLKTLSEKERLVFELRHYQGMRLRKIGEIMGSSEETAKNYLFRATRKLRSQLAEI